MKPLNELVDLAKKATPGEWKAEWYDDERGYVTWYIDLERQRAAFFLAGDGPELNGTGKPTDFDKADCNFIAAANPAAILAIAEHVKSLEDSLKKANEQTEKFEREMYLMMGKAEAAEEKLIPAGWKLVPVVAFPSQWAAGKKAFYESINKVDAIYRAMLDAAPEAPHD